MNRRYKRHVTAQALRMFAFGTTAFVLVSQSALAQDIPLQPGSQDQATTSADGSTSTGDIVVTGSRIKRAGNDTLEPATVVGEEFLEQRALTNVGDALRLIPSFSTGQSPSNNQSAFTAGANFADRFGLGSARTLTLVNGRRFVSTNPPSLGFAQPTGLQVDLNVFPSIMIERIENIAIGGAPTYGSDAVAGVVNVVLRSRYDGAMVTAQSGITARGDNERINLSGLVGQDFAGGRGNVTFALSYDNSLGVQATARESTRRAYIFQTNPLASSAAANLVGRTIGNDGRVNSVPFNTGPADGIPDSVLIRDARIIALTKGGLVLPVGGLIGADGRPTGIGPDGTTRLQFAPDGSLVPFTSPVPFGFVFGSGGDGYDNLTDEQILADVRRVSANANATYDVANDISVYFEGAYADVRGRELRDEPIFNTSYFGGTSISTGPLAFSVDDPRLTSQARSALTALGVNQFWVSRASTDLADQSGETRNRIYRGVGGIRGRFEAFGRPFNFDASANYGRTDGDFYRTEIDQQKFVNALNVRLNSSGQLACDPNPVLISAPGSLRPQADASCVTLDLFGEGRASAAALDYVTFRGHASSTIEQTDFLATLGSSDLFSLWSANPVGFSVGVEHRREAAGFSPDPLQSSGVTRNAAISPVSGKFSTNEVFGEILVPIISPGNNVPLIDTLEFEGRARYVDNSVNGGFTAYTFGGRYRPVAGLEFRGNYTRSLRAPSVVELFFPQSPSGAQFPDPCDTRLLTQGTAPSVRQRNCAAFFSSYGITPGTFTSIAYGAAIPALTGGNPELKNETAKSYTFGAVLRPRFLPKFQAAIDWNRIRITDNITLLSTMSIAEGCYDDPNFDTSNPDAGNRYCSLFQRVRGGASNGQLSANPLQPGLQTTFVNGAFVTLKGLTAEASYSDVSLAAFGLRDSHLALQGTVFYLHKFCSSDNGVTVRCLEGTTTNPRYTAQLDVTYFQDKFSLNLGVNYRSSSKYDPLYTYETQDVLKIKDLVLFDLSASVEVTKKTQFRLTINNLLDTSPIFPTRIGDLLGRRFTVKISQIF